MNQGMIEFNGDVIKYPNGNTIHIVYDEQDGTYTFDVFNKDGEDICTDMCLIHQAHAVAVNET